jgi:hypothetical protein
MFSSNTSQVSSGGYEIQRSLRFNSADSAYLNRTPASAGNRRTWTWSAWVKRSELGTRQQIFNARPGGSEVIEFQTDNTIQIFDFTGGFIYQMSTVAVYRDPSAWYHIVWTKDTTQATDTNRMKLYVNGVQIFFSTATYPALNSESYINNNVAHHLGTTETTALFLGGYMTEVNFIDGQALTPSSFGAFDAQTGVWGPTRYGGSYGTNGFYLNFSDNSNTTAATLGRDYSGNSNNWTPNNFSVSAGAGNDSLVDVPTNWGTDTGVGGSVRGNYATLNPLTTTSGTYTQGNLRYTGPTNWRRSNATISRSEGKWYWEVTLGNAPFSPRANGSEFNAFGFGVATSFGSVTPPSVVTDAVVLCDNGWYKNFSGSFTDGGTGFSSGDVLSIAVDLDANTFTFRRNNTSLVTGTIGGTAGRDLVPIILSYDGQYGVMDCNFGQRPFAYTAPSGFKALNTQNLPTPTIGATTATQANKYFDVVLRNGGGSSGGTYSTTVNMANGAWLWDKPRSATSDHFLVDSVRGISKTLSSNTTAAESTYANWFTGFNNGSFTTGSSDWSTGTTVVDWIWAANGAGVTNTAGTITSTVSANTTSGFSVVTYTGTGANATVGHGLGAAPRMIIIKNRSSALGWPVYHASLGTNGRKFLFLNTTDSVADDSIWNSTNPTSTVFSLGAVGGSLAGWANGSGNNLVAYCFAEVPGYSSFGSYVGNGVAEGPFCFTGFRPAYVMIKNASLASAWIVYDNKRNTANVETNYLLPNSSGAEATLSSLVLDFTSNGFKIRGDQATINTSNNNYIFAAFAEAPQKFALAR